MKTFFALLLSCLLFNTTHAQIILIEETGCTLNGMTLNNQKTPDDFIQLLGKPDRISSLANTIWTYDDLGLYLYFNPQEQFIQVSIQYEHTDYDFSPKHTFTGKLKIHRRVIHPQVPLKALKWIPQLVFDEEMSFFPNAKTAGATLFFHYTEDEKHLTEVSVGFD